MSGGAQPELDRLKDSVAVQWTDARAETVERAMRLRGARRQRQRVLLMTVGPVVTVFVGFLIFQDAQERAEHASQLREAQARQDLAAARQQQAVPTPGSPDPEAPTTARTLTLADGSTIEPRDGDTRVAVQSDEATATVVDLAAGAARFDVTPRPARTFRVQAGAVAVEVLGTAFTVDRLDDDRARVAVQRGRVRVRFTTSAGAQSVELTAGADGLFPPAPSAAELAGLAAPPPGHRDRAIVAGTGSVRPADWARLAEAGDYDAAFTAVQKAGAAGVRDDMDTLLRAADVARLSHHADDAVPYLQRALARHGADPRAPLAAFTLGRVLLDELGRPREAASAFDDAHRRAPRGPLAEDALARATEAWSRAGARALAKDRAAEYLLRFPDGRRARQVRRLGGLD